MSSTSRIAVGALVAAGVIGVTATMYAFVGQSAAPPRISGEVSLVPGPGPTSHLQPADVPVAPALCDDDADRDDLDDLDDDDC